jgi:hypothetical protein
MTLRSCIALLIAASMSACGGTYRVQRQYFDDERALADTLPAVRESDGAPVVVRANTVRPDLVDPRPDAATVRVRNLGTRHLAFRVGLGVTIGGAVLTIVGAALLAYGLGHTSCNDESGQCNDRSGLVVPGFATTLVGMGLGAIVGPIVMTVGANLPPREVGALR